MTCNGLPPCPPRVCSCPDSCPLHKMDLSEDINPEKNCCTVCTGDGSNNVWFQARAPGFPGRCILDELTFEQVWLVLLKHPQARKDLLRITNDSALITLANDTQLEVDALDDDQRVTKMINGNTLPFYTLFRGRL